MKPFDTSDTQQYPAPLRLPAPDELTTLRRSLEIQRGIGHRLEELLKSERIIALRRFAELRARIAELEDQLATMKIQAGFERTSVVISGKSYAEVAAELSRAVQIDGEELIERMAAGSSPGIEVKP